MKLHACTSKPPKLAFECICMCSRNEDKIYFANYKHYLILCFAFFCIVNHHKFKIEPYIGITGSKVKLSTPKVKFSLKLIKQCS